MEAKDVSEFIYHNKASLISHKHHQDLPREIKTSTYSHDKNLISKQARLDPVTQNTHQELVKIKVSVDSSPSGFCVISYCLLVGPTQLLVSQESKGETSFEVTAERRGRRSIRGGGF